MVLTKKEKDLYSLLKTKGPLSLDDILDRTDIKSRQAAVQMLYRIDKKTDQVSREIKRDSDNRFVKYFWIGDQNERKYNGDEIIYSPASVAKNLHGELTKTEKAIMEVLEQGARLDSYKLAEMIGKTPGTIRKNINRLLEKGAIIKEEQINNRGKKRYFIPAMTLDDIVDEFRETVPRTSLYEPYEVEIADDYQQKLMAINTPFIGAILNDKDYENLLRNSLRYAEVDGIDGIILSGNTIFIDLMRYSKLKPYRSRISGIVPNPELIKYPDAVKEAGRNPEDLIAEGKPVYLTFKERLDHVVSVARDLFNDVEGNPLYSGNIYMTFGNMEEELAIQHTNEVVKINVKKEQAYAQENIREIKRNIKDANKGLNSEIDSLLKEYEIDAGYLEYEVKESLLLNLLEGQRKDDLEIKIKRRDELKKELRGWEEYEARLIMTNTDDGFINITNDAMQNYIINTMTRAIPNSRIISIGNAHLKVGNQTVKVTYDAKTESIKDTFVGKLRMEAQANIKKGDIQPDLIIGGGLNPTYTKLKVSYDTPDGHKSVDIAQLPTCLDKEVIREIQKSAVKYKEVLSKIGGESEFTSGVMVFEWDGGIPKRKMLTNEFLKNSEIFSDEERLKEVVNGNNIMYMELDSDNHRGSRFIGFIETEDDIKYLDELTHMLLKEMKAPIIGYFNLGDITQAHNYPTEQEVNRRWRNEHELQEKLKEVIAKSKTAEEAQKTMMKYAKKNTILGGILNVKDQVKSYITSCDLDYFADILRRAKKVGLFTTERVGVITYIRGNHDEHTTEGEYSESEAIANELALKIEIENEDLRNYARENIKAPQEGTLGLAEGLMGIVQDASKIHGEEDAMRYRESYLYGIKAKHKQGTSKHANNMKPMQKDYDMQGSTFGFQMGRMVINLAGHDHFGGESRSPDTYHIKGSCQMFKSPFGEKFGFTLPNLDITIFGLPKDGPASGPLVTFNIRYEDLKRYVKGQLKYDVKKLFENSVIYDD